jgi:hypothetical protein
MPALWYAFEPLLAGGWRVVLVWDELVDRSLDRWEWTAVRVEAAVTFAGGADLLLGKSVGVYGIARDDTPAIALTPALVDAELVAALRSRGGPLLLVGGSEDPLWDGAVARQLTPDVLEVHGADHGLARTRDAAAVGEAAAAFSARLARP